MPSYYDKVLEDFESEAIFDHESADESSDEAIWNQPLRRPTNKLPGSLDRRSNFEKNVSNNSSQGQGNFATKSELKSSLTSISDQVNDLKKANLILGSSLNKLEKTTESVAKGLAKEGKAQASTINSSTMMSLIAALVNKPILNVAALKIIPGTPGTPGKPGIPPDPNRAGDLGTPPTLAIPGTPDIIEQVANQDAIQVDLTKTLLFTMMPMMMSGGSSGGGDNNMMMPLMMVLLLSKPGTGLSSGSSIGGTDNTLVMVMMMMMMMNKK